MTVVGSRRGPIRRAPDTLADRDVQVRPLSPPTARCATSGPLRARRAARNADGAASADQRLWRRRRKRSRFRRLRYLCRAIFLRRFLMTLPTRPPRRCMQTPLGHPRGLPLTLARVLERVQEAPAGDCDAGVTAAARPATYNARRGNRFSSLPAPPVSPFGLPPSASPASRAPAAIGSAPQVVCVRHTLAAASLALAVVALACLRPSQPRQTATVIPQPTPDQTMDAVVRGLVTVGPTLSPSPTAARPKATVAPTAVVERPAQKPAGPPGSPATPARAPAPAPATAAPPGPAATATSPPARPTSTPTSGPPTPVPLVVYPSPTPTATPAVRLPTPRPTATPTLRAKR